MCIKMPVLFDFFIYVRLHLDFFPQKHFLVFLFLCRQNDKNLHTHNYIISRFRLYHYFCMMIPPSMKDVIVLLCSMGTWDLLRVLLLHACAIFSPKSDFFHLMTS